MRDEFLMRSIKTRRKRYAACDELVREAESNPHALRALAPEASESTNSTTRANGRLEQLYCSVQASYYHIRERVSSFFCGILSFSFLPL